MNRLELSSKDIIDTDKIPKYHQMDSNFGEFTFYYEDDTLGNILQNEILKDKDVIMCSYKNVHPVDKILKIIIKTKKKNPIEIIKNSLKNIENNLNNLKKEYNKMLQ